MDGPVFKMKVDPRPALPREVAQYTPYEWQRLYVTPGLSCLLADRAAPQPAEL